MPSLIRGGMHAVLGPFWPRNPWTTAYRQERLEPSERPVGWLSGSCLLVRRSAFGQVGGFDERYFMYMEDVDLGDRLGKAGWLSVYVPSAEVLHHKAHSTVATGKPSGRPSQKHLYLLSRPTFWLVAGSAALDPAGITGAAFPPHGAQFTAQVPQTETEAGRRAALSWQLTKSMRWSWSVARVPDCGR